MKAVAHFSCGATSAIATVIAIEKYGIENVEIVYADPGAEHPDNQRFLKDCERVLFKKPVTVVRSAKYKTIFDVFEEKRYLAGIQGAPCTLEMKKIPIRDYLGARIMTEKQVFGYDPSEVNRARRFENNNPEVLAEFPLIEMGLSKQACLARITKAGIALPAMYRLGYSNANCIGCVKAASVNYWRKIRKDFPDTFDWYAKFERVIGKDGAAINKRTNAKGERERVFLDEIDKAPDGQFEFDWDESCGYTCGATE